MFLIGTLLFRFDDILVLVWRRGDPPVVFTFGDGDVASFTSSLLFIPKLPAEFLAAFLSGSSNVLMRTLRPSPIYCTDVFCFFAVSCTPEVRSEAPGPGRLPLAFGLCSAVPGCAGVSGDLRSCVVSVFYC